MAASSRRAALLALIGAIVALGPALALFDFTVDDALIPARYASHIARGLGYRFNATGAVTDGVTPLGFPYLLAPFAGGGVVAAFHAAKLIGLAAWVAASGALAVAIDRVSRQQARFVGLGLVALSVPLGAWCVAGLETGMATALVAWSVTLGSFGRRWLSLALAGLAAAVRPELLPWALALAVAPVSLKSASRVAFAGLPFALVVAIRMVVFGRPAPLAVLAKPSDELHGLYYAAACFALTGPVLLCAPWAFRKLEPFAKTLVAATFVHFAAVIVAGGDWMPLSRLVVPVLPCVALAGAYVASVASARATFARALLAAAGMLFQAARAGPSALHVGSERAALMAELEPALADAKVVAALDVGWVGAVSDGAIVDLAGLTDPAIAALPGGHTTKAVPASLLDARGVDAIVLLRLEGRPLAARWSDSYFARGVELRIAEIPGVEDDFEVRVVSERPHLGYVVLRRRGIP